MTGTPAAVVEVWFDEEKLIENQEMLPYRAYGREEEKRKETLGTTLTKELVIRGQVQ